MSNLNLAMILRKRRKGKLSWSQDKEKKLSPRVPFINRSKIDYLKEVIRKHPYNIKAKFQTKKPKNFSSHVLFEDSKR